MRRHLTHILNLSGVALGAALVAGTTGCFDFPDLELVDEIPIVGQDSCAPPREVRVGCIVDGDTFDIDGCGDPAERVRLLGLDAPEVEKNGEPAECWGDEAEVELRRLIDGRQLTLTFDQDCLGIFGRTLAYAYLSPNEVDVEPDEVSNADDAVLINELMLARGNARLIPAEQFGTLRLQAQLEQAETQARARQLGLYAECPPEG